MLGTSIPLFVVVVYGYPGAEAKQQAMRNTRGRVLAIMSETSLQPRVPVAVGGDFNCDVTVSHCVGARDQ
eukprot:11955789-Alexandrium_andersonii.AAC.1